MKRISFKRALLIVMVSVLIPMQVFGQETEWYEFELDNIRIDFPSEEVFQYDTIVEGIKLKQLYSQIGSATLVVQNLPGENTMSNEDLSSLPYDYKSLIKYYEEVAEGARKSSNGEKVTKKEIKLGELIGYNAIYYDETGTQFYESNTFLVDNNLIVVSCYDKGPLQNELKINFFNSLNLENFESLEQYTGTSKAFRLGQLFGKILFYGLILLGALFLIKALIKKK